MPVCPQEETVYPYIQSEILFFFLQFKPYCFSPSHHAPWSTAWLHPARPLLYLSLFINVLPVLRGTKLGPGILDVVLTAWSAKDR